MLGFAILDRAPHSADVAVWLTTRVSEVRVDHTNAVLVSLDTGPEGLRRIHGLTRERVVMCTPGSTHDDLPVAGEMLSHSALDVLVEETLAHREAIVAAVQDYRRRARKPTIKLPEFPRPLDTDGFAPVGTPVERALRLANLLARLWEQWLVTDEERRRRTKDQHGATPWMMPEALNQEHLELFPSVFGTLLRPQPLDSYRV